MEVTINLADLAGVKGRIETLLVVIGLHAEKYPRHLIGQFIGECVELKQFDMLTAYKKSGVAYLDGVLGDRFGDLVSLFTEKELQDQLTANPQLATWKDGDPVISGTATIAEDPGDTYTERDGTHAALEHLETALSTPKKAGRKNGPGVKTAEKIRKATNAPVKKTTARKKASGAADGK